MLDLPHGIILVTGPTGSGKTTTLYAALSKINNADLKIITIEDPVEYQLRGINQIQVNTKSGLTFASGLRSILRHDPDVVLIGEIRDRETAEIAVQASLTGHLVFSTLHTNDAPGATTRLVDMGDRAVSRRLVAGNGRGPAAGAIDLPQVQGGIAARRDRKTARAIRRSKCRRCCTAAPAAATARAPAIAAARACSK